MVQKVIMKYWLNLQTHSAYMLFYKRVELEEENGKDFSFDVSPDLLEVLWVYFFKFKWRKYIYIHVLILNFHICLSFSGFGMTTCSFSRIKIYLNTPTLGGYKIYNLVISTEFTLYIWRPAVDLYNHYSLSMIAYIFLFFSPVSCGSSAAASPALCQTLKPSPSWLLRWGILQVQAFFYFTVN